MSIYIQGMEIPKKPILFCIHPDGKVFADLEGAWGEYQAIPVPPHGRLIDADALCDRYDKAAKIKPHLECGMHVAVCFALTAPTIIEAEGQE